MTGATDQFIIEAAGKRAMCGMISWADYDVGNHRIECPSCGRGGRDKTAGLTIEGDGKGVVHCFRCTYVESYRPERGAHRTPIVKAEHKAPAQKYQHLSDWGRDLWRSCRPLSGVAVSYLRARHCRIPPEDGHLRWHPAVKHPSGYVGPALMALITDVVTRKHLSLHRTWILPDGNKAPVDPPRRLLGRHRKQGGVIRLWPDEAVTTGLAIAEGIETTLTMAHDYQPVWSLIDAGNMEAFPVLAGIESLVIGADHDATGLKAAKACADRWAAAGVDVRIVAPDLPGSDWNDVVVQA